MAELGWRDVLFSLKTFAAAMLAVYIAFRIPLPQPSWAMLTVYVVSQPLAGMVLSKSMFRVMGTMVGAGMSLVLVDLCADTPELFLLMLALWIGACTYVSVYLRDAPAAYGAMLAGYTAAIVGVPAALSPLTAFDLAWARCLEITLGIACATLASQIAFPRAVGEVVQSTLDAAVITARQWTVDVLRGQSETKASFADRNKLVADIVMLDSLLAHAVFDTPTIRVAEKVVRQLQARLLKLLSVLIGVDDRLTILHTERPEAAAALQPLLDHVAIQLAPQSAATAEARTDDDATLDREIANWLPTFADLQQDRHELLVYTILLRLHDVREDWREIQRLHERLWAGVKVEDQEAPPFVRYRDPLLAAVGALVSTMAVLTAAAFWIATGWPHGSQAVIFAGVICSILASLDDPATAATSFLKMTFYAAAVAAVYVFVVFPRIDGFVTFMAVLMPFYLPLGMIIALPRLGPAVLPLLLNTTALLTLGNERSLPNIADFLNVSLGLLAGIFVSILMFRLLRPLGVAWTVHRLTAAMVADLAHITVARKSEPRFRFESRMYDRINALFARLDPADPDHLGTMQGSLAAVRVGLNILTLKVMRQLLAAELAVAVDAVFRALARKFGASRQDGEADSPLRAIDETMSTLLRALPAPNVTEALVALDGIHTSLSQHPGFFALPAVQAATVSAAVTSSVPA